MHANPAALHCTFAVESLVLCRSQYPVNDMSAVRQKWLNAAFKARALLDQGSKDKGPPWLEAIERFGMHEPTRGKTPKQIQLPEDSLFQAYIHKHPQFRQAAVDLNSENPSAIKLFVLTQAALIEKGHSRKEAYQIVEDEFKKAMAGSMQDSGHTALVAAQRHEETLLQDALRARREVFGLPANLQESAPADQPFSFRQASSGTSQAPAPQSEEPAGFQPSTSIGMAQAISAAPNAPPPARPSAHTQNAHGQQHHQGSRRSSGPSTGPQQDQRTAPAGFVQFGVSPQGPAAAKTEQP